MLTKLKHIPSDVLPVVHVGHTRITKLLRQEDYESLFSFFISCLMYFGTSLKDNFLTNLIKMHQKLSYLDIFWWVGGSSRPWQLKEHDVFMTRMCSWPIF